MSDVLNPVQIEQEIRSTADRIYNGVKVCSERYAEFVEAEDTFDRAFAQAYMEHDGPAHEKKYAALLATTEQKDALNIADTAYRHADRKAKALDAVLRAWQSVGASVRSMYGTAGRGE